MTVARVWGSNRFEPHQAFDSIHLRRRQKALTHKKMLRTRDLSLYEDLVR